MLQTKRDTVTKESNEFKADYGRYMATMSKKVVEGKAEHARLTEYVSELCVVKTVSVILSCSAVVGWSRSLNLICGVLQGTQLQRDLKQDEFDIIKKQKGLKKAKQEYTGLQKKLKGELKTLQVTRGLNHVS